MFHATADLPVQIVRPANAYGEGQRAGVGQGFIAAAIDAVLKGRTVEIYGATGTIRDYIHVVDVAEAICAALQDGGEGEIYNIGTGCGASNLDVIHLLEPLASEAGLPVNVKHLPERRFDVAANVLDPSKLMAATSWRPQVDLAQGLRRVWEDARRRLPS